MKNRLEPINVPAKRDLKKRLAACGAVVAGFLFIFYASAIESWLFPVVGRFEIVKAEENGDDVLVYLNFEKLRDCTFQRLNWYRNRRDTLELLEHQYRNEPSGNPSSRPQGFHSTGPWHIKDVTLHEFKYHVKGVVNHRCHVFYDTVTVVY